MDESVAQVVRRLAAERPRFHQTGGQAVDWGATPGTLALIAEHVGPGSRSLETGAGASTVVFAAAGARHVAISPSSREHAGIREWCAGRGISTEHLTFCAESSTESDVLRNATDLDVVFIDGRHAFPSPIVDWHYCARALRRGGVIILDDVPIPSVAVLHRFMSGDPGWAVIGHADSRAVAYRKLADIERWDTWQRQPFNADWPDYSFLPPLERTKAGASFRWGRTRAALGRMLPPEVKERLRRSP